MAKAWNQTRVSEDGTRLAFAAFSRNGPSIWIRDFATLGPRAVAGDRGYVVGILVAG
jgi:hypothetical protein